MPRLHVETTIEAAKRAMEFGSFLRSIKTGQPYLIELVHISLLFTATWAAYDEVVVEGLWTSGAS
jgi:hypothetical protein